MYYFGARPIWFTYLIFLIFINFKILLKNKDLLNFVIHTTLLLLYTKYKQYVFSFVKIPSTYNISENFFFFLIIMLQVRSHV